MGCSDGYILMITFEKKRHIEIDVNYQGINLIEFSFVADNQIIDDQIVDTFIRFGMSIVRTRTTAKASEILS
jgi:hypothetical protein